MANSEFKKVTPENKSSEEKIAEFLNQYHRKKNGQWIVSNTIVEYQLIKKNIDNMPEKYKKALTDPNVGEKTKQRLRSFLKADLTPVKMATPQLVIYEFSDGFKQVLSQMGLSGVYIQKFQNSFLESLKIECNKYPGIFGHNIQLTDPTLLNILNILASDTDRRYSIENASAEIKDKVGTGFFEGSSLPLANIVTDYLTSTKDLENLIDKLATEVLEKSIMSKKSS